MIADGKRGRLKVLVVMGVLTVLLITGGVSHRVVATEEAYEKLKVFSEVLSLVRANYVEEVDAQQLVYGAIRGLLESLDPHSSFMSPQVYKEMQAETHGSFGGLGIEITVRDRYLTIVAPIEGTPADRAGIQAGDRILKIEDELTKDMTLIEAVRKLRGPKGSTVAITIGRNGQKPFDLSIVREIIQVHSVKVHDLGDGIGYVRLTSFQERTARELEEGLEELEAKQVKAIVLDLRNNPGGLLNQAVQVSDLFLKKGQLIVYTEGRAKNQDLRFVAEHRTSLPGHPMVVLVNGGSASASEIVAGALQDWKRAVILGTATFGKGSVQTVIPLSDGSGLRLTTAKYFTPKGRTINETGIAPDIVVEPSKPPKPAKGTEPFQNPRQRRIGEQTGDTSRPLGPRVPNPSADPQLGRAVDILKATLILEPEDRKPALAG